MSFRRLEESIRTLEDVSEVPMLRARIEELEEELVRKGQEYSGEIQRLQERNANLVLRINSLRAENKNLTNLKIEYKKEKLDLKEIDRIVRGRMDKTTQKRIEKQAQKLCNERLPHRIEVEIKKYPHSCSEATRIALDKRATQLSNEILRNPSRWPSWFKESVRREVDGLVKERMNRAFWDSVKQETDKEINIRLPGAWKSFLGDTATSFMQNSLQAQLLSLAATRVLSCPKCGGDVTVTLTPNEISILLQKGMIVYPCLYSQGIFRHKFRITLGELIWLIMKGNVIPMRYQELKTIRTRVLKRGGRNDKGVRNEGSDQPNNP